MAKQKKKILLIVETSRAFGRGLLQGISRFNLEHDEWAIHVEDRGLHESIPAWLKKWKGDGIISRTASVALDHVIRQLNIPIVELFGDGRQIVAEVQSDEHQAAALVVEHFLRTGHRYFAFFGIGNTWWSHLRQRAFEKELSMHQATPFLFPQAGRGKRVFYPTWEPQYENLMFQWLRSLPKPVAVWAASDTLAIKLLEGCRRAELSVPEQVAILGSTNDALLCNLVTPSLSSIDMNSFQIGHVAATRLARKMQGETVDGDPVLIAPAGVVTRRSTDVLAVEIAAAVHFIRENATSNITVDDVADALDISRSTLQRRFRRLVGRTVEKEIIRTRMERARQLLRETKLNLHSIAMRIGFATNDYFIQAFRRETGMTPKQYRLLMKETAVFEEDWLK